MDVMRDDSDELTPPAGDSSLVPFLKARMKRFLTEYLRDPCEVARLMREYDHPTTEIESQTTAVDRGGWLLDLTRKLAARQGGTPVRRKKIPRGPSLQREELS
jgi:hypothetical protein